MKLTADKFISEKELLTLLKITRSINEDHYFLFFFLSSTGLRISEALDLDYKDVFDSYLIVRNGKGGKSYPFHSPA